MYQTINLAQVPNALKKKILYGAETKEEERKLPMNPRGWEFLDVNRAGKPPFSQLFPSSSILFNELYLSEKQNPERDLDRGRELKREV